MMVWIKRAVWAVLVLGALVAVVFAFQTQPVPVDRGLVTRGELVVAVEDDGVTRVRERFTIDAPVQGRLVRTTLDPGAGVRKGETVVAEFAPIAPNPLDERSRAEARSRLHQAEAALEGASSEWKQSGIDREFFRKELDRIKELVAQNIRGSEARDRARRDFENAEEAVRAAAFRVEMARFGVELAKSGLREVATLPGEGAHQDPSDPSGAGILRLRAPVKGRVLRVFEESMRTVVPGTPLMELGDVGKLEIAADFLSQDAVKVRAGMPVRIDGWGGETADGQTRDLRGIVRLVEPSGFIKVSALGVEEQRVNIIIDPADAEAGWPELADGFRIVAHIELWRGEGVLLVPAGALFRQDGAWSVFAIRAGVARLQPVKIGRRSGLQAEVLEGLAPKDPVVLYPSDLIQDGIPVAPR